MRLIIKYTYYIFLIQNSSFTYVYDIKKRTLLIKSKHNVRRKCIFII